MKLFRIGLLVVALALVASFFYLNDPLHISPEPEVVTEAPTADTPTIDTLEFNEPETLFGFVVDSFSVISNTVRRNQFLGEILSKYRISDQEIHELSVKSKKVFDVRKIGARRPYTILATRDSIPRAEFLIYEPNNIEYVVYKLKDSIEVSLHRKQIDTVRTFATGVIETSLWDAMTQAGADPGLIHALSEVYAWQVDFYRIQKGDKFKVIYEDLKIDGETVGIGEIIGAWFSYYGEEYYAIYFDQGSGISYFDENGQSLQKQFLRAPLQYSRISSRYTGRRYHPVLKRYKAHLGTDYAAPTGTPIRSVGDGTLIEATYNSGNGNYVKIRHNSVYTTQYLHMSRFAKGMKKGVKVKQGQVIGYVGSTGLANGPHLCFRFWKNGQQVDALKIELPPSEPVQEDKMNEFLLIKNVLKSELDSIQIAGDEAAPIAEVTASTPSNSLP
jgi:murein DD-endopeptidase MepM/ murein hydrolase activator NlpD